MSTVLVVEDELPYQKILKDTLEKAQFTVILASEGKQEIIEAAKDHPDIILLDIMLPGGMNGFDLLEELKANEQTRDIPVIVLTNIGTEESVAREIGADRYFVKSDVEIETIIDAVNQLVR